MAHYTENLEELCEIVDRSISKAIDKLRRSDGELSAGDAEYIDYLTHTLKSIKTTLAMEEYDDEYSGRYDGGSSYARGRRGNVRRDSMGRYSGNYDHDGYMRESSYARRGRGYSRDDAMEEMREQLEDMERMAKDEKTRQMVQRWKRQIEE